MPMNRCFVQEGRHTIIYTKKAYPREIIKIEAVGEKAAKVVAVSRIDERELAKSSGKGHQLSPEARRQCSAQNLTAASYLRSLDGLHLLYPDTWNEIDFVYHQVSEVLFNRHTSVPQQENLENTPASNCTS